MPTILVVDDHQRFRAVACAVLTASGWEVVGEAGSGEEAIAAAQATHPDVVLMDVRLPGIDGIEATRRILTRLPGTDVVLVSSRRLEELPSDAATCGAVRFLAKEEFGPEAAASLLWGGQHPLPRPG